jgi:hypothetical protein
MKTANASVRKFRKVKPSEKKNIASLLFCRTGVLRASRIACVERTHFLLLAVPAALAAAPTLIRGAYRDACSKTRSAAVEPDMTDPTVFGLFGQAFGQALALEDAAPR